MKTLLTTFTLCLLLPATRTLAQARHDYIWVFGYGDFNLPPPYFGETILDFNGGQLDITRRNLGGDFADVATAISDSNGQLQFYTNGCHIFNALDEIMLGGDSINFNETWDYLCNQSLINYFPAQSVLALPLPQHDSVYWLFHLPLTDLPVPFSFGNPQLRYSVIDMSRQGGLGEVVLKDEILLVDTALYGSDLTAVKHANGTDWWIVLPRQDSVESDRYWTLRFTSEGVDSMFLQQSGIPTDIYGVSSGQAVFSPDGTRYARYNFKEQVMLFDFDRGTGLLSNFRQLWVKDKPGPGGIAFSPSSRFLYVSSFDSLFQFDLEAPDIQQSRQLIAVYEEDWAVNGWPTSFNLMRLGPDCRIYIQVTSTTPSFHLIHHPDRKGAACGFEPNGLTWPAIGINGRSLPNHPNYRLGTPWPVCDSTILLTATAEVVPAVAALRLWPNPAGQMLQVEAPQVAPRALHAALYDARGREVRRLRLPSGQSQWQLSLEGLPAGLYLIALRSDRGELVAQGRFVVGK